MDQLKAAITQSLSDPVVADALRHHPDLAARLSTSLEAAIRNQCGGRELYIASRKHAERDALQQRLAERFNGRNYSELASQCGLHERTVRRMLARPKAKK